MAEDEHRVKEVIFVLHGIRDVGAWMPEVKRILETDARKVVLHKYGYFDVIRFLSPFPHWRKQVRRLRSKIAETDQEYPGASVSLIAHSFGTYVVARMLKEERTRRFHRVVFCGGVVPGDFDWGSAKYSFEETPTKDHFINECGNGDYWPLVAEAVSSRYGRSGTDGFGGFITDRYHEGAHSAFLNDKFAKEYWVPFFDSGTIVDSTVRPHSGIKSWFARLCTTPWIYISRSLVLALYAAWYFFLVWLVAQLGLFLYHLASNDEVLTEKNLLEALPKNADGPSYINYPWLYSWRNNPVHLHGTIGNVSTEDAGESGTIVLLVSTEDAQMRSLAIRLDDDIDWPHIESKKGRPICLRAYLEQFEGTTVVLADATQPLVYISSDDLKQPYSLRNYALTLSGVISRNAADQSLTLQADDIWDGTIRISPLRANEFSGFSEGELQTVQGKPTKAGKSLTLSEAMLIDASVKQPYNDKSRCLHANFRTP